MGRGSDMPRNEMELWGRFCSTGQISDYLAYRGFPGLDSSEEDWWETDDADNDRRAGDQGAWDRRPG